MNNQSHEKDMNHQGVGQAQLNPPTPQPRTELYDTDDRQVGGPGSHKIDEPGKAAKPNDMSLDGDTYPVDNSVGKFQRALRNAERALEKEKLLNMDDKEEDKMSYQTASEDADGAEFMNIRSDSDPAVFYTIIDETPKANKSNEKKKKMMSAKKKRDRLVESIKRILSDSENKSVTDDSTYSQFSQISRFTDALANFTTSTMSSTSFRTEDSSNSSVDSTLMSTSSADDSQQSLKERNYHQSKDEETLESDTSDEESVLSGYSEKSSPVAVSPNEKQERTQGRGGTVQNAFSEPSYVEYKHDSDDDDHSCDATYDTRGSVGLVQDILNCCMDCLDYCIGDDEEYLPEEDHNIGTKLNKDSKATDTTPPTSHLTVKKRSSSKTLAKAAEMAKDEDVVCQEEEDANAIAEALHKILLEKNGVFSDESTNGSGKNDKINGSLDQDQDVKPRLKFNENSLPATSEASNASSPKRKSNLRGAAKSLGKSISSNRREKCSATQQIPIETDGNEGHAIVTPPSMRQKSSATLEHPIEIDADQGQKLVSPPSIRKTRSAIQQTPIEFDVGEDQTILSLPILQSESHHSKANIDFAQATEQDLPRRQTKTLGYGYEMSRKVSFREMIRSRSSTSKKSSHTPPSVAETLKSPNQSGDDTVTKSVKQSSIVVTSISPHRTLDICFSSDSAKTEPELAAIAARKWKSAVDKTTGKTYYYNKLTKEVTWDTPAGFVEQERQPWKAAYDATSGRTYYYNRQTKAVTWKKPDGFIAS